MPASNVPDTEQEIQKEINDTIAELGRVYSDNELTQIGWLVYGLDLWHQTDGKFGHTKDDTTHYVISSVAHLLAQTRAQTAQQVCDKVLELIGNNRPHNEFMDEPYFSAQDDNVRIAINNFKDDLRYRLNRLRLFFGLDGKNNK